MSGFSFAYHQPDTKSRARVGEIVTPHGVIQTPAFVPVGTQATIKSLSPEEIRELQVQLFFVNTYHMYLRPGMEVIQKAGGLHKFMAVNSPIITDSGGFQVFSLGRGPEGLVKITEDGVEFRSHWDGSKHLFTPELSMEWQAILGSDIHIAFDDCTPYPVTYAKAKLSMERTHRWAERSLTAHTQGALYGVVQGSIYEDLRIESAKFIRTLDTQGIAIGGVSVGESKKEMEQVLTWVVPNLPDEKPRHLLGVGEIDDVFVAVEQGMDTFDCVQPTRMARMGRILSKIEIDITKTEYKFDMNPLDVACSCYTCSHFSRAYVHHLFRVKELLAYRLATIHNIYFMQSLVTKIRTSLRDGSFLELKKAWLYDKK